MTDLEVNAVLQARNEASAVIRGFKNDLASLGKNVGKKGLFGPVSFSAAAFGINQLTGAMKTAVGTPLELAANFEYAMNRINAFSGGSFAAEGQLASIEERARELGSTTEFTATQVANAFATLTQAGFTYQQQMDSIETVVDFATAGQVDMAKAADIVGATIGSFNLKATQAADVADVLAVTATSTQSNIVQVGNAMRDVGPVANSLELDIRQTAAAIAILGQSAIRGGRAGKALKSILLDVDPTKKLARDQLRALGIGRKEMREAMESGDITAPLRLLKRGLDDKGLTGSQRNKVLKGFFGKRRQAEAQLLLDSLNNLINGLPAMQAKLKDTSGALEKMSTTMRTGTKASAKELMSALEELGITVGQELQPVLNPLIDDAKAATKEFATWAKKNPDLVKTLGKTAMALVAIGTVAGPTMMGIYALRSVFALAEGSVWLFTRVVGSESVAAMGKFATTASRLNPAISTMIGSKAGMVGMLGAAGAAFALGYSFGTWADETFGISDKLSGLNTELSIHNDLLAQNISLQVGLSKVRGSALLGDLTKEERKKLDAAQKRKEKLSGQLAEFSFGDDVAPLLGAALPFFPGVGKRGEINENIQRAQAEIDAINKAGLDRRASMGREAAPTMGRKGSPDSAMSEFLDKQVTGLLDTNGSIKIQIDDKRARVVEIQSGDIPLEVDQGMNTPG